MTRNSRNHNARVRKSQTSVRKRSGVKRTRRRGGRTHTHTTRTKRIGGVLNADLLKNPDWKLYNIPTPLGDANVENKEYVVSKKGVVSRLRIGYIRNSTLTNMSPIPVVFLLHNGINSRDVVSGIYPVVDPTKNSTSSSSFVVVKDTSGSSRGLTINKLDINQDTGVVKPVSKSWFASENTISLLFQSTDIRNDVFNRLQILSESAPSPEQLEQLTELVNINVPNSYNRVQNAMHNVRTGAVDSFKNVAHDLTQGKIDVANTAKGALLGVGTVGAAGAAAVAGATAVSGAIAKGVLVDGLLKGTVNNMQSLQARVQQNPNRVAELTQYSVEDIVALLNSVTFRDYICGTNCDTNCDTNRDTNQVDAIKFVDCMKDLDSCTGQSVANCADVQASPSHQHQAAQPLVADSERRLADLERRLGELRRDDNTPPTHPSELERRLADLERRHYDTSPTQS